MKLNVKRKIKGEAKFFFLLPLFVLVRITAKKKFTFIIFFIKTLKKEASLAGADRIIKAKAIIEIYFAGNF
jgi:hypothetical protein